MGGAGRDRCLNLQAEGASAVHAAIDMCLQASGQNISSPSARTGVAVGQTSYHGPPSTSPGGSAPLGSRAKGLTLDAQYPVPTPFFRRRGSKGTLTLRPPHPPSLIVLPALIHRPRILTYRSSPSDRDSASVRLTD